jgi:hypothetical protein
MIYYRPTDGDVYNVEVKFRPKTCFLMAGMGSITPDLKSAKRRVTSALRRAGYTVVDANSETTGKDYLSKIWLLAVSCPIGVAIVHQDIRPATMANIYYELGLMQAYGRETVVVKVGEVELPSDLVRTEYIEAGDRLTPKLQEFLATLQKSAEYYRTVASQLKENPLLAIDYLRRSYLLTGDKTIKRLVREIEVRSGLAKRAPGSVERMMAKF